MSNLAERRVNGSSLPEQLLQIESAREALPLGAVQARRDIPSTIPKFLYFPDYHIQYPQSVVEAMKHLLVEYNLAFTDLVRDNREWEEDYQYCRVGSNGDAQYINYFAQVDMAGMPHGFLSQAGAMSPEELLPVLRGRVFEMENSLAVYNLLSGLYAENGSVSHWGKNFRQSLDMIRQMHGKPIALLAGTEEKYNGMRSWEFGKLPGESLSDDEVRAISGFDTLFGPHEFIEHLKANGGESAYLLYARTSSPVSKLREPGNEVEVPLLADDRLRRIVRKNALTFNIDRPDVVTGAPGQINDTKAYLEPMGMAYTVHSMDDLHRPKFQEFLAANGLLDVDDMLRAKPLAEHYGCYGHERGQLGQQGFINRLARGIAERGPYVLQREIHPSVLVNTDTGVEYNYIDRNFMFMYDLDPEQMVFMGGFRNMLPADTMEAKKGRLHGAHKAVYGQII